MIDDKELSPQALILLQSTFNIKFAIDCMQFDTEPEILQEKLACFAGKSFGPRDKILLVHMDTDYYDPLLPCGTIPINVTRIFQNLDIPLHALLFVTNHYGIKREFDLLLKHSHPADQPIIVETLLCPVLLCEDYKSPNKITFDKIEKPAICMMGRSRSHRVCFYNFLVDNNLLDKIAVSQHFNV